MIRKPEVLERKLHLMLLNLASSGSFCRKHGESKRGFKTTRARLTLSSNEDVTCLLYSCTLSQIILESHCYEGTLSISTPPIPIPMIIGKFHNIIKGYCAKTIPHSPCCRIVGMGSVGFEPTSAWAQATQRRPDWPTTPLARLAWF